MSSYIGDDPKILRYRFLIGDQYYPLCEGEKLAMLIRDEGESGCATTTQCLLFRYTKHLNLLDGVYAIGSYLIRHAVVPLEDWQGCFAT